MNNQETPDFFSDHLDDENKKIMKDCEEQFKSELESRKLEVQRFENNKEKGDYLITFSTENNNFITCIKPTIKECFEAAIAEYDRLSNNKVPISEKITESDTVKIFKNELPRDVNNDLPMIYRELINKLQNSPSEISKEDTAFFLEYYKDHDKREEFFELAGKAQKILNDFNSHQNN
jgi:hypothetical protein